MKKRLSGFETGSGCYQCRLCGKETRETGGGESSSLLCAACDVRTMAENSHNDAGHKPGEHHDGCPVCGESESVGEPIDAAYHVVDADGLVAPDDACPCCDERRADRLVWTEDGERLMCSTCWREYGL